MKALLRLFYLILIIVFMAAGFVFFEAKSFLQTAPQNPGAEILFDVAPGASFTKVAEQLKQRGLITDSFKFGLLARYKQMDNKLQAGRFALHSGWTPDKILQYLVLGDPLLFRITIREGLTWWETGKLLEKHGFVKFEDFKAIIMDSEFLRKYGIPFNTAEGFLMPDTYLLRKDDYPNLESARLVASRLVDTFWQKMSKYWPNGQKPSRDDLRRVVILASIVEKETGVAHERARVAGVYANRLRIEMPLQADPTIIYGLGPNFDRNIRRVHLDDPKNLYNTYQHRGLPPGPICSPGVAALRAAITPEKHSFLYFVAITDGGEHAFSKNLREHQNAVRRYLNNRKKKNNSN